ncbi:MAG: acetylxylan esterase [Chloroflexi bacterium]|nr:acetylxylan esterase [Chloroflexota bacterium]
MPVFLVLCATARLWPAGRRRRATLFCAGLPVFPDPWATARLWPAGRRRCATLLFVFLILSAAAQAAERFTGPWDLSALHKAPEAVWGERTNLVQEVYYEGEPFHGKPTRIFAYYGRPDEGEGPFPAMLLVHGGGGKAFAQWAEHWAKRGYVALAMDTAGHGPKGRLADGGPEQNDESKFREFTEAEAREMWTYHVVAAVLRGHSLLAAQMEVDPSRIGITGISWGGYLTCIVAGLDERLKVAVPVYGCGFLDENSCWLGRFDQMSQERRKRWVDFFDPAKYLRGVRCPILFLNGSNDFAYPLDSYRKSYRLVPGPMTLSVKILLPHGHIWTFGEVDCFVDGILKKAEPLPRLNPMQIANGTARAAFVSTVPLAKAELNYTSDAGDWQKRVWKSVAAALADGQVTARLPAERPLVCYLSVTDQRVLSVSTPHEELPAAEGR